jgi:hypothetical protein
MSYSVISSRSLARAGKQICASFVARMRPRVMILWLLWAAAGTVVGCGHEVLSLQARPSDPEPDGAGGKTAFDVGSGGMPGSGSIAATGGDARQPVEGAGGSGAASGSGGSLPPSLGGEGGGYPGCFGAYCPPAPCCQDVLSHCEPWEPRCTYCSAPEACGPGLACDPLTDQCLPACMEHFECPNTRPLCDDLRGICVECYETRHCQAGLTCIQGTCVLCDATCQ